MNGQVDLTDNITFETDVLYSDRDSYARNAGYPFQSAAFANTAGGLSADSYFNPVGQDVNYRRRGWEVPRGVFNNLTTVRMTNSVRGSFEFAGDRIWDWDCLLYTSRCV